MRRLLILIVVRYSTFVVVKRVVVLVRTHGDSGFSWWLMKIEAEGRYAMQLSNWQSKIQSEAMRFILRKTGAERDAIQDPFPENYQSRSVSLYAGTGRSNRVVACLAFRLCCVQASLERAAYPDS